MQPPAPFPLTAALTLNAAALASSIAVANWTKIEDIRRRVRERTGADPLTGIPYVPRPRLRTLLRRLGSTAARARVLGLGGFVAAVWYAGSQVVPAPTAGAWYWALANWATWLCALLPLLSAANLFLLFRAREAIENELK
jgi:hypothetical protein